MIGAIAGDIIGSIYEFGNIKTKDFELFGERCRFTDDTVMTVAVAYAISESRENSTDFEEKVKSKLLSLGRKYPKAGYGRMFFCWLFSENPMPYNSFGNGSAMRVSPCGMYAKSLDEALTLAEQSAKATHNHPEGIKGAQAAAAAVFLAKEGKTKEEIKAYIEENFYKLDKTLDEIRPGYSFDVTCQGSVPQAIQAFLESTDYEDAIRNAVSIGGDSDTIACITGGIAEAYYGVPKEIKDKAYTYLDDYLKVLVAELEYRLNRQ